MDVDIPALNDNGAFNSDEPVLVVVDDLVNAKFSTFGLAVDDLENKFANGLVEELSLVLDNLLSAEDVSELPRVNPEPVRMLPLGAPTKEGCVVPNDAWEVLNVILLSNLNVTDLAVVTAGLFKGGKDIQSPTRTLLLVAGSALFSVSSSSRFDGLFRPTSGNFIPPKLSVVEILSVLLVSLMPSPLTAWTFAGCPSLNPPLANPDCKAPVPNCSPPLVPNGNPPLNPKCSPPLVPNCSPPVDDDVICNPLFLSVLVAVFEGLTYNMQNYILFS